MLDPLLNVLAAKAKAVGLVAGTALVTSALVGGGAIAMTSVSSESALEQETVVTATAEVLRAAAATATPTSLTLAVRKDTRVSRTGGPPGQDDEDPPCIVRPGASRAGPNG